MTFGTKKKKKRKQARLPSRPEEVVFLQPGDSTSSESSDVEFQQYSKPSRKSKNDGWTRAEKQLAVILIICIILIIVMAVLLVVQHAEWEHAQTCDSPNCVQTSGNILKKMDLTAKPCDNFYQYACGKYENNPLIPPDRTKWGIFSEVTDRNDAIVKRLLDEPGFAYKGHNSTAIQKSKLYYAACMNTSFIEAQGNTPMLQVIAALGSWSVTDESWAESSWSLEAAITAQHQRGIDSLFGMGIAQDDKEATKYRVLFDQSGTSFDDYEDYLGNETEKYRTALVDYLTEIGHLLGGDNTTRAKAEAVWELEKDIAKIMLKPEERQDMTKLYHLKTVKEVNDMFGDTFDVKLYLKNMFGEDIPDTEQVIMYTVPFYEKLPDVIKKHSKETFANYICWQVVQSLAAYMPTPYQLARLKIKKTLTGVDSDKPQWNKCVSDTGGTLGFATGALYVDKMFTADDKANVESILNNIRETFGSRLPEVSWMDEETRKIALDKVNAVVEKIGYPEFIKDPAKLDDYYKELTVIEYNAFQNALNALTWSTQRVLKKRGKPVDIDEWDMAPADVNAYYTANKNQIVFPAGILQDPFYDTKLPMAMNYGAAGMVIGHELTHGFDNSGRLYDKHGNMQNWWTNASATEFKKRTACLINQYNQYPVENSHVNGITTLGENIADNGGLKTSYVAYHNWLATHEDNNTNLPALNMTPDQLFFLGFAQLWCAFYTHEYAKQSLITDPHTFAKYRVIGVLSNMKEFSDAFQCSATDAMNPSSKCVVW